MFQRLFDLFRFVTADAHCDVPCGIYDPSTAQIAAKTVATLTKKIVDLPTPSAGAKPEEIRAYENTVTRMIQVKEEHARICKTEILILWTDFFKPNHLEMFPDLHTLIWNTAKLVSYCKQNVDLAKSEELQTQVGKIAEYFQKAQAAAKK
jgi:nickel superoxide dismutase